MKAIKLLGISVVAVLAFGALTTSAFAQPTWLVDKVEAPAGTKVDSKTGKLLLEDMGVKTSFTVEGTTEGTVGPKGADETTKITVSAAAFQEAGLCETSVKPTVEAVHLPYTTSLVLQSEEVWDNIREGPTKMGLPGWLVECTTIIGKVDDVCTTNEGQTLMTNDAGGAGVSVFFNETVEATCTGAPGAGKGLITNVVEALILSTEGLELEVDAVE